MLTSFQSRLIGPEERFVYNPSIMLHEGLLTMAHLGLRCRNMDWQFGDFEFQCYAAGCPSWPGGSPANPQERQTLQVHKGLPNTETCPIAAHDDDKIFLASETASYS